MDDEKMMDERLSKRATEREVGIQTRRGKDEEDRKGRRRTRRRRRGNTSAVAIRY